MEASKSNVVIILSTKKDRADRTRKSHEMNGTLPFYLFWGLLYRCLDGFKLKTLIVQGGACKIR